MSSSSRGSGGGREGFIIVAPSLRVSSCETSSSSSESERITGSSGVPDVKIRDRVITVVGICIWVWLDTFDESTEPIRVSLLEVPRFPK